MSYGTHVGGSITNTSFTAFAPSSVYHDGESYPTGRAAASGTPIYCYGFAADSAYNAGGISGTTNRNGFQGTSGGTCRTQINYSSGTLNFGRNSGGGGVVVDAGDSSTWAGSIPGTIYWDQAPTAPQSPAATPGVSQALVNWAAPADDGQSAITGYRVYYSTSSVMAGASFVDVGVVTSTTITGLTPGVTYYFTVAAKNAVTTGNSTVSVSSSIVSAFIASVPGAPTALAISVAYHGSTSATATAPASDGGSAILDYLLEWSTDNFATVAGSAVVPTSRAKTVVGLTPNTGYYFRMKARNAVGYSAASATVGATTPVRSTFDVIEHASAQVSPGVQVSLRSDGANTPTITLGFSALLDGTTWTSIAVVPTNAGAGTFATPGGQNNLELVMDPSGNLYVIGNDAANPSSILVKRYARTGVTNAWTASGLLSQALPSTGDAIVSVVGAYVAATGVVSPKASIFILARRAGTVAAGGLSYATLDIAAVAASSGSLFLDYGLDPSWLAAPTSGEAVNTGRSDVAPLTSTRVVGRANGFFVADVTNGIVAGVSKAADGASGAASKVRVIPIGSSSFAVLAAVSGALTASFYGTNGTLLGSASYPGSNAQGGAFDNQWDAFYNRVTGTVRIYYVAAASTRKLVFVDLSPSTYLVSAETSESTTLGAASSTNPRIRIPAGAVVDERRILVEAANLLTGVYSTTSYSTTTGNVAPGAPALDARSAYDATGAALFTWSFGDSDPADVQSAYQLQIQRVSDSVDIVDSGKVASAVASRTVAGGSLTNGVAYRWRVRVYDALDQVGAWSNYSTFTPSSLGTLTITAPVSDNIVGIDSSGYTVVWTYSQANGYTQTKRRVVVTRTSDNAVLSDTTLQASTVLSYAIAGLLSDTEYRIDLTIENTNAQQTSTSRLITPSFSKPMTPTVTFSNGENYVDVIIANPAPTGSRPDTLLNYVFRRATGATTWTRIGSTVKNGTYRDRAVRSGGSYDYQIQAVTA